MNELEHNTGCPEKITKLEGTFFRTPYKLTLIITLQ